MTIVQRPFHAVLMLGPILGFVLAACSPDQGSRIPEQTADDARVFSAAEKEAARMLAIGAGAPAADPTAGPLERAARCRVALAALREALAGSDALAGEQLAALREAEQLFERRARAQAGIGERQVEAAMRAAKQQQGSVADEARQALACVRRLQQ